MKDIKIEKYKPSHLSHEFKEYLTNRLNRAKGHLESVIKMLEQDRACEEIVLQLSAVRSAINEAIIKLLEGHIEMCINQEKECNNLDTVELIKVLIKALRSK